MSRSSARTLTLSPSRVWPLSLPLSRSLARALSLCAPERVTSIREVRTSRQVKLREFNDRTDLKDVHLILMGKGRVKGLAGGLLSPLIYMFMK
jgi:hypothetical protein